jgi:hypothetical protein
MKRLKDLLEEAVSDNARNKALAPYRRAAKSGMSEKAASYVGLLEILLDELSDTTKMDDKTFKLKVDRYGARSKLVSSFVKKEQLPLDSDKVESDIEKEPEAAAEPAAAEPTEKPAGEEPMKSVLPDEPDVSGLVGDQGEKPEPKPAGRSASGESEWSPGGGKTPDMPSLKKVATQKKKPAGKKAPEKKKKVELETKPESGDPPELQGLKNLMKKSIKKRLRGKVPLRKVDTGPLGPTQSWTIGQTVKVGFTDGLLVVGGDPTSGWVLTKGDKRYLFVPSANPKMGRGLYRIG